MRTRTAFQRRDRGTVLMVSLFMTFMLSSLLWYYLGLVRNHNVLVTRSQAWNSAMGLAEAGVEEALAQLNPGAAQLQLNPGTNGWGPLANGFYGPVSRLLSGGSYSVVFTPDQFPIIYSTGYVTIPTLSATLARTIRVGTTNMPLFTAALACRSNINFAGNGVFIDSFNSMDPNFSTNGRYDPLKTSTNGDVASVFGLVNVGNGNINGKVLLGPIATDTISANGRITGGVAYDFNIEFEDVVLPQTSWLPPPISNVTIDGITYQYVFSGSSGDYVISALSGNIFVDTNTTVRLLLQKSFNAGSIRIAGGGATAGRLTIFMNGPSFTVSGSAAIDGGNALNFAYYGTPNNTLITFGGNAAFTGTIYAPEAIFKLGGGGSSTYDFVGSCFALGAMINGHYSFHFDENLLKAGPFKISARSWTEL